MKVVSLCSIQVSVRKNHFRELFNSIEDRMVVCKTCGT